jgi:hypothetical protein
MKMMAKLKFKHRDLSAAIETAAAIHVETEKFFPV